ncbi:uncharacterized protein FFFS_07596 [Fusarium fujikuroi]|nr:uncharacterized protein FFFS_07596 [Fusarium fujikuroi]
MALPAWSEEEILTASESEAEEEIEVPLSQPALSQSLPARCPIARQNASKRAMRRAPRSDIQNPGLKARWTRDQMEYLLESYGAKRVVGELENEKTQLLKTIYAKIGCYDYELGIVTTTDDNWDRWVKKHGIGAAAIKRNGL